MIKLGTLSRTVGLMIALVACPAIAMAEVTKFSDTFDQTINCGGEDIDFLGTVNFQLTEVEGGDTFTGMFKGVVKAEGYGLDSGDTYILREKFMNFVQAVEPPFVFVENSHGRIIGMGDAPNYFYRFQVKFVVNGNGEVVLDTANFMTDCEE